MSADRSQTSAPKPVQIGLWHTSQRAVRQAVIVLSLIASALWFPGGLPWLVAAWMLVSCGLAVRGKAGVWPLVACITSLLVKQVCWMPGLVVVLGTMTVAGVVRLGTRQQWRCSRAGLAAHALILLAGWIAFTVDWETASHASHGARLDARPVLCVGDSLSSGEPQGGYVPLLQLRLSVPVIDLSEPGITTSQALKKLPEIRAARPQAIVIELCGHDFLKGYPRAEAKARLEEFIALGKELEATVILMEVPRGFIRDGYWGLERELAREYDLELVSDTSFRRVVYQSSMIPPGAWLPGPHLSDDGLHPNANGNELLANTVAKALSRVFGAAIRQAAGAVPR